ncbi:VOC family protein [Sphingomonas sp.]|uniref:VOC family protein n=1 Tax=Sphingomonas sp. TaxID=28214 RepID=UPI002DBEBDDD|nr:VOC family protein [Sphingomonas sp.]HEU4968713.1 VOC family protein [Sphingomonas sp.]
MPKMVFVNLPVENLDRSVAFYEAIGCTKDPRFSNDQAAMMVWSDTISFMLLTHPFYQGFTSKPIADAHAVSQALFALSFDSRAEVDAIMEAALAAGGREHHPPEDLGFMYSRAFEDPDGHGFGPMWMDVEAALSAMPQNQAA